MPSKLAPEVDAQPARRRPTQGEGRHQDSGCSSPPFFRENIGNNRQCQAAKNAAERARKYPGHEQHDIPGQARKKAFRARSPYKALRTPSCDRTGP